MVYIIAISAMIFWSLTYVWYKVVFESLTPITVMFIRLGFSSLILFTISFLTRKMQRVNKNDRWLLISLSFFQPFLFFLMEAYGVSLVSATVSAVIISTIPIFTPIVAYLFFKEKISITNVLGILISFIGVLLVVFGKEMRFNGSWLGILLLLGAVMSALFYAVIIVRLTNKYNPLTIISWQNLFGTLFFLPIFFVFDFKNLSADGFSSEVIKNLFYLAFFGSSIAYVLFTYTIKNLGITKATMFTNIIPVFTAILSVFILNENLDPIKWIGISCVVFGLFFSQKRKFNIKP